MADAAMKHEASATAQGALCNQCLVFQLSKARFKASPFDERHMHQLGQFTDVLLRNHCPLCKFVTYCFQNGPIASEVLVGARIQGCWSEIVKGLPNACLTIFLVPRNEQGNIALNIRLLSDCNSPQAGMGRLLGIDFVDSSVIRNWTDNCHKYHQCSAPISSDGLDSNLPPGFILIDTLDMCLVEVDCPDRFLALSYVWGDSVKFKTTSVNVGMLKESNAIRKSWSQLSPTIRDAIMLTSSLNERYIWIDSLCILQDNSDNSQANITAMDSIYRRAHLVIIAADDRAMNEGLLGVTTPRAKAQQATELFPGLRVLGTFSYSTYMDISTYETRGWTFQEDYLSTRAVIFINDQVYFSCRSHVFTEDVHEAPDLRADSTLLSSHMSKRFIRDNVQPSVLYLKCVETYTTRRLTHTEDILDAFSGAGKALGNLLSARMIYGLPNSIFDLALLWQPVGRSTRRKGFPSWSWAGWNEPVQWVGDTWGLSSFGYFATAEQERTFVTRWLRERTWIDWYCVSATGDLGPVWSATESKQSYYSRTSIGYDHAASSDINLFGRDNTSRDPILTNLVTPRDGTSIEITRPTQQSSLLKNEYFLYFSTLTAKFYIEPSDYYLRYGSIDPVWEPNGRTVFLLRSKTHQTCGYVLLQSDWRTKYSSDVPYDFLLLSEANYDCKWSRPHENHPYKKSYGLEPNWAEFHVMMVQQNPTLGGDSSGMVIVERVGIGRLLKEAMGDACEDGPRWKQILLG